MNPLKYYNYIWLCLILFFLTIKVGFAQTKIYADNYGIEKNGLTSVSFPENGLTSSDDNYAILNSIVLGSVGYQLKFLQSIIPKGVKLYVKTNGGNSNIVLYNGVLGDNNNTVEGVLLSGSSVVNEGSNLISILNASNDYNAVKVSASGVSTRNVYYAYFYPIDAPLTFKSSSITACNSYNLLDNLNYSYEQLKYEVLKDGNVIPTSPNVIATGNYIVRVTDPVNNAIKTSTSISVTINPKPTFTLSQSYISISQGSTVQLPTVQGTNGTVVTSSVFKNNLGDVVSNISASAATSIGFYNYTVAVTNNYGCTTEQAFVVYVTNSSGSCPLVERVYADEETNSIPLILVLPVGAVVDAKNAVDKNLKTYSNMYSLLNLLGLTTFYQELTWSVKIPKGSKVVVKLSSSASLANVAAGLSIRQRKNGGDVGSLILVNGGLVDLVAANNETYFAFTATDDIDGIRLIYGGALGLSTSVKIYEAWYERQDSDGLLNTCAEKDVIDVVSGSGEYLKGVLNVASGLGFVTNPWNIADADLNTFATLNSIATVGTYVQTTAVFKTLTLPNDTAVVVLETNFNTLNLLGNFLYIQRYLGETKIGQPIYLTDPTLITLLNNFQGSKQAFLIHTNDVPYDKISIVMGSSVSVLDVNAKIYEVFRKPYIPPVIAGQHGNYIVVCKGDLEVNIPNHACTTFEWYDAEIGGNKLTPENIKNNINNSPNVYRYYIQANRYGCPFGVRVPMVINIHDRPSVPNVDFNNPGSNTF